MKAIGEKVLGWFIIQEDDDGERPPAAREKGPRAETRAPMESTVQSVAAVREPTTARSAGLVLPAVPATSFVDVYRRAGVPDAELERLTKTLDLLASLPVEAAPSVRRPIVEAALQAFGVSVDRIADTALAAVTALDRHIADGEARMDAGRAATDEQVRKLAGEIERLRTALEAQAATQVALVQSTARERARITSVLEFFGRSASTGRTR